MTAILVGRCSSGGTGAGRSTGAKVSGRSSASGEAFEAGVAGEAAGHRLQPQPQARGDGRRAAVAAGAGEQDARGAQRAHEIMRGEAGAEVEPGQAEVAADARGEPRVGARRGGPNAFVHPAEDHQIGLLEPRFEQAPDADPRVAAVGAADRDGGEQFAAAARSRRLRRGSARAPRRDCSSSAMRSAAARPSGPRHAAWPARASAAVRSAAARSASVSCIGKDLRGVGELRAEVAPGARGAVAVDEARLDGGDALVEAGEPGARARAAQREVEVARGVEPGEALRRPPRRPADA